MREYIMVYYRKEGSYDMVRELDSYEIEYLEKELFECLEKIKLCDYALENVVSKDHFSGQGITMIKRACELKVSNIGTKIHMMHNSKKNN